MSSRQQAVIQVGYIKLWQQELNRIGSYHKYLIAKVPGSGRGSEARFAVRTPCRKPPCCSTHSPTLARSSSAAPSASPVLLPTGALVLTKGIQNFLLPAALMLPNCDGKLREVGLCTHLLQGHRNHGKPLLKLGKTSRMEVRGGGHVRSIAQTSKSEEWQVGLDQWIHGRAHLGADAPEGRAGMENGTEQGQGEGCRQHTWHT